MVNFNKTDEWRGMVLLVSQQDRHISQRCDSLCGLL